MVFANLQHFEPYWTTYNLFLCSTNFSYILSAFLCRQLFLKTVKMLKELSFNLLACFQDVISFPSLSHHVKKPLETNKRIISK